MTQNKNAFALVNSPDEFDELISKSLPSSPEAERAIVGAIILRNDLVWQAREYELSPDEMYVKTHGMVLSAMYTLADASQEINPILIADVLEMQGQLASVGGISWITNLTYGLPHFANLAAYVKIVKQRANLRLLERTVRMIQSQIIDGEDDHDEIMLGAESAVLQVTSTALRGNKNIRPKEFISVTDDRLAFAEGLEKLHRGESYALPTGIRPLDMLLEGGGLNPQGLYILAAKPKSGKTSLALSIVDRAVQRYVEIYRETGEMHTVGVISMEMRRRALQMRLFSAYTGVPFLSLSRPGLRGPDYDVAMASVDPFFDKLRPLHISDAIYATSEMWRAVEKLVQLHKCGLLVVDYMQLAALQGKTLDVDRRTAEVTAISREFKHMGSTFDIPVLAISSLNQLGQLRESRALEYDAEAVIKLTNPDWKEARDGKGGMTREDIAALNRRETWDIDLDLETQRNGPTGVIPMKFMRPHMRFLTHEEYGELTRPKQGIISSRSIPF